jgi:tetratricopeptide (TPR) repeat protein
MVISINPNYYSAHFFIAAAYWGKSMYQKVITEWEKAADLSDGIHEVVACLTWAYYFIGKKKQSEKLFDILKKKLKTEYVPATCFYMIHRYRGEEDLAFEWLERACNDHDSYLPTFIFSPNDIVRIPDEPRYKALLKKFGLEE